MEKIKNHSEKWFKLQEKLIREPFKNTKYYYLKQVILFVIAFVVTKDYYHGWLQFAMSFLNISIFFRITLTWWFLADFIFWAFSLAWQIVSLILMIKSIVYILQYKYFTNIYYMQKSDYMGKARTITNCGPPGCGKTFTGANIALATAQSRWQEIKFDYFTMSMMVEQWARTANVEKLKQYEDIKAAYLFYSERENEYIPCLISSVPIEDVYGRRSYQITEDLYKQIERIPERSVLFYDESGAQQGCNTSKTQSPLVVAFWRYYRHFGDYININTDQGDDGNAKYIRKSTDYNCRLYGQEWIMKPTRALNGLQRAKAKYYKNISQNKLSVNQAVYQGQKLYYRNLLLKTIGYRKIQYKITAADKSAALIDEGNYIIPAIGEAFYDDRAYRNLYLAKNKEINLKGWKSLSVDEFDVDEFYKNLKSSLKSSD